MAKDPAALFFIDKWLVATKEMKAECRGWYLNLILHQFDKRDLPNDIEELANLADVRISEFELFKQMFEQVLKHKFKENSNGRLENEYAAEILKARELFKEKRSNAGKMSYFIRYVREHLCKDENVLYYLKQNIDLTDIDIKDTNQIEQVFKQVFQQKGELFINVIVNENIYNKEEKEGMEGKGETKQVGDPDAYIVPRMVTVWHNQFPKYLLRREIDFPALKDIAFSLCDYLAKPKDFSDRSICSDIITLWNELTTHIAGNDHYSKYNLSQVLKYIQSILQSYNRPKAVEKSELQCLYEKFRENGKMDIKQITEGHYNELHEKNLVAVDDKLIKQSRQMRLKILDAPKDSKERALHEAYKSGNPDHPLVKEDTKIIELHAKRTAVLLFFKKQREGNSISLLPVNKTA